jgi:alkylhydroperoxidase family enzyme
VAWLRTIPSTEADGPLAAAYEAMANRPMPPVYKPEHGGAPGIIRAHSLDPALLAVTFSVSGALAQETLPWRERELLSSVTSRTNQCFY